SGALLAFEETGLLNPRSASLPVVVMFPGLVIFVIAVIRRLHDRDRSVWSLAAFFLPAFSFFAVLPWLYNSIVTLGTPLSQLIEAALVATFFAVSIPAFWCAIELFVLRGTSGRNRFGEDPLQRHS